MEGVLTRRFLAYLEDQGQAHPFGKQVKLRLMDFRDGSLRDLTPAFLEGQGTINIPYMVA